MADKSFLDKMFDGAEAIVGGLEKSKELSDPHPDDENGDAVDAEFRESKKNPTKLIWGADKQVSTFHLFEDFQTTALCARHFEPDQLTNRKTEMGDGNYKCCGMCIRVLQSRYERG